MTTTESPPPLTDVDPADQTRTFFDALFGYAPTDLNVLLWTLQDKRSTWVRLDTPAGTGLIADRARDLADTNRDVYVAVSLAQYPGMHDTRIKSDTAAGIVGLWADIDIADPDVHKKWNLPPSLDDAMKLLHAASLEPTIIVHSGHGLQAWWLFKEFWAFDDADARAEAAGLAQRWNTTLQVRAAEQSWVVDSTFDLARVMRVPGTMNRKGSPVVPVTMLHADGPHYTPEDIEAFCVDASSLNLRHLSPARSYVPDKFEISDANTIDFERFQALRDNDPRFQETYDMARRDFTDQSASSYDMSLASQAAAAAWSDKEIAALILAFRRRHKLDVSKALRPDYIRRTISRARDSIARSESAEMLDELGEAIDEARASGDPEVEKEMRRAGLDGVSAQLGVEVIHLVKYLSDPPAWALQTPVRTIPLGASDGFLQWHKFRQAIVDGTNLLIDRFKPAEWDQLVRLMLKAVEEQDVGAEATERGEVAAWLSQYLAQRPPAESLEDAALNEYPFIDQGRVVLFGPAFRRWLYLTFQEKVTNKELGRRLRDYGCEPDKVNVELPDGKRTSRGVWRLPVGKDHQS
jgi:hypothetical protein